MSDIIIVDNHQIGDREYLYAYCDLGCTKFKETVRVVFTASTRNTLLCTVYTTSLDGVCTQRYNPTIRNRKDKKTLWEIKEEYRDIRITTDNMNMLISKIKSIADIGEKDER